MNQKFDQKLALNIANPTARVQTISRVKINPDIEDKLIEKFIGHTDDDPTGCTAAMQGRPVVFRVQMALANKETFAYQAAISKIMTIRWPGGLFEQLFPTTPLRRISLDPLEKAVQTQRIIPTIEADSTRYSLLLAPYHLDNQTRPGDEISLNWPTTGRINALPEDPDYIKYIAGLCGISCGPSFRHIVENPKYCADGFSSVDWPHAMRQVFHTIQKTYENAVQLKTIGKPIYTEFDPEKEPRGMGHITVWYPFDSFRGGYFEIPDIKYHNPNKPMQLIHQDVRPKRIVLDDPKERLTRLPLTTHQHD